MTRHYRWGGVNSKHFFLTILGSASQRSRCQHGWVMVRAYFLACRQLSSCCIPHMTKRELWSLYSLIKAPVPSCGICLHGLICTQLPPRGFISEYYHTGDHGLNMGILRAHKHSVHSQILCNRCYWCLTQLPCTRSVHPSPSCCGC